MSSVSRIRSELKNGTEWPDRSSSCDTFNHHLHTYCKACKRNLANGTVLHDCIIGIGVGKIHPEMNPAYLINTPWWEEPCEHRREFNDKNHINFIQQENKYYNQVEISQFH